MRSILNRTTIGLFLLATTAWAGDSSESADLLADDIDVYLTRQAPLVTDVIADAQRDRHAMFWSEAPDRFMVQGGVWWAKLTGPITVDGDQVLDVSDSLGLDSVQLVPFVRLGLRLWRFEIIVEGWWFGTDGRAIVDEEFEIGGEIFPVNAVIDSRLTLSSYRLALGYEFWRSDHITATVLVGVSFMYSTGRVETVFLLDRQATWKEWLPIPAIGLSLSGEIIGNWIYEAEGNWIGFSTNDYSVYYLDVRAAIGYQFNDWILARAGYRLLTVDGEVDEVQVDLQLAGFFIEAAITF